MCPKNVKFVATRCVISIINTPKLVFGRDSAPNPVVGAYDAPRLPRLGMGTPLPIHFPSILSASRSGCLYGALVVRPPTQIPGYVRRGLLG